jgi:hypothetical protein
MTRKWLVIGFVIMLAAFSILTGCGRESGGNAIDPSEQSMDAPTEVESSSPVKPKPELKGKIRIGYVGLNEQSARNIDVAAASCV